MNLSEFQAKIKECYRAKFPESRIDVQYSNRLGSSICIQFFLANDSSEVSNKIWQNDTLSMMFFIHELTSDLQADSELPEMELTAHQNHYIVKSENIYKYCDSKRVNFRKVNGSAEKIVNTLEKFFNKLQAQILEDYKSGQIHPEHSEIVKIKVFNFAK